jgi:three-Cys-motif partner protein
MDYWTAKPHAEQKYTILGKYLAACGTFARRYRNFAYIDTHGGSGLVKMEEEAPLLSISTRHIEGSPLIAARAIQAWAGGREFPCHIIEIHPGRYETLCQSMAAFPWVHAHRGDCNVLLPQILEDIPTWAFVLCFVDPDGLVYEDPGSYRRVSQFTWSTMQRIASRSKVEVLLNFPLEAILRTSGYCEKQSDRRVSETMASNLTTYFGCEDWRGLSGKRQFLGLYLGRLRALGFQFAGAYYIRGSRRAPLYYLVFATRNQTGAKIMRDVMRAEWRTIHPRWADVAALAGFDHPLDEFIFDDEALFISGYPPNWDEIALSVKEAAGWCCEECGQSHDPDPEAGNVLTVHHRNGNPANCAKENLVALCQRCHLRAQGRLQRGQRSSQTQARQLALFNEGE